MGRSDKHKLKAIFNALAGTDDALPASAIAFKSSGRGGAAEDTQRCTIMTLPPQIYAQLMGPHDKKVLTRMYGAKQ